MICGGMGGRSARSKGARFVMVVEFQLLLVAFIK